MKEISKPTLHKEEGALVDSERTSKNDENLSQDESTIFYQGKCPDCQHQSLLQGPTGGGSINYKCTTCGSRFNEMGPFGIDRISDASPALVK